MFNIDLDNAINKTTDLVDDSFESGEERQKTLTERLRLDMASDNPLAKMIRPIITLTLLALQIIVVVCVIWGVVVPDHIVYELGAMLGAAIGFYFNSRRNEKIVQKKANAYIQIEEMKVKASLEKERVLLKQEVKEKRKSNRKPLFNRYK